MCPEQIFQEQEEQMRSEKGQRLKPEGNFPGHKQNPGYNIVLI